MIDDLDELLKSLEHPGLKTIDLSLGRMQRFLKELGSPEKKLPPVIHVAGTNGKGSLVAYLQAIFETAGYKVHRYTSPHLVRFHERIVIAGKVIEHDYLMQLLQRVKELSETHPVTFFEATTAAAFLAFSEHKADVVLLEVGMGGRFDATNVIDKPALTAITPISIDHAEYLGDTLAKIAYEKAGIMKPGVSCVIGPQEFEALITLEEVAEEVESKLISYEREWTVSIEKDGFNYHEGKVIQFYPAPALEGKHQKYNAATAVACIKNLPGFTISEQQIWMGLTNVRWPARLQYLTSGPLVEMLRDGDELWLDGGHNPAAGEILAGWAKRNKKQPLFLICAMTALKDTEGFLKPLSGLVTRVYAISIPDEPLSKNATDVAESAKKVGMEVRVSPDLSTAIGYIKESGEKEATILIAGSLYLAGYVLKDNN